MYEKLIISSNVSLCENFSEYYLIKIPQRNFKLDVWTIGEPLTDHCVELIYDSIRNLVITSVLSVEYEATKIRNFLGKEKEKIVFRIAKETLDLKGLGWLENQILYVAKETPYYSNLTKFISELITHLDENISILTRNIIYQIAKNASPELVFLKVDKGFWTKKLSLDFNENASIDLFSNAEGLLGTEYLTNEHFRLFSVELFKILKQKIESVQHKD